MREYWMGGEFQEQTFNIWQTMVLMRIVICDFQVEAVC